MGCCFSIKDNHHRGTNCRPYKECSITAAQILAIVAFVFSVPSTILTGFTFWIAGIVFCSIVLIMNIVGLVLFQIPWCCRKGCCFLNGAAGVAVFLSVSMLVISIYAALVFDNSFLPLGYIIGTLGAVGAILWAVAATQMFVFVRSGRHAEWEKEHNERASDVGVAEQSDA